MNYYTNGEFGELTMESENRTSIILTKDELERFTDAKEEDFGEGLRISNGAYARYLAEKRLHLLEGEDE